jgi:mRNA interferase RelE/StbE
MYEILFDTQAEKQLKKIDSQNQKRILEKIEKLKNSPNLGIPLTGNLAGLFKLRIGDYRTIYQIRNHELIILVLKIGHRRNVYD